MRIGLLTVVFVGVIAVGLAIAWIVRETGGGDVAVEGEPAPDFSVTLFDGTSFDLASHLAADGRPMVLNLWASWCEPCRTEIPAISEWSEANPEVYVLGVAVDDREAPARALVDELEPSYATAFGDPDFRNSYPSFGLPATYFIDPSGQVALLIDGIVTSQSLDTATASISD